MKKTKKQNPKAEGKDTPKKAKPKETSNQEIYKLFKVDPDKIKENKEHNAERFEKFIERTGIKKAFGMILNEIIQKNIDEDEFYDYVQRRLKEISIEYKRFIAKKKPHKKKIGLKGVR